MRPARIGLVLAMVAGAVALAGCGGGGDNGKDTAAGRAAQAYVDAYNARDFETVCGLLSESYKDERQIGPGGSDEEGEERSKCPEYFQEHTSGASTKLTLVDVQQNAKVATAHVRSESQDTPGGQADETVGLQQQPDGSWQVTDVTTGSASG